MRFEDIKEMEIEDLLNVTDLLYGHYRNHNLHLDDLVYKLVPKKYHSIYHKIVREDIFGYGYLNNKIKKGTIWTSRPFNGRILKEEIRGKDSGSDNYDRLLLNTLEKNNLLIEFRYGRHGKEYVSFFTYVRHYVCWKNFFHKDAVLFPCCVLKIAKSWKEITTKVASICMKDTESFDRRLVEIRFAEFVSGTLVRRMSKAMQSGILPSYEKIDHRLISPIDFINDTFIPILEQQNQTDGWDPEMMGSQSQDVIKSILHGSFQHTEKTKKEHAKTKEPSPSTENISDEISAEKSRFFCQEDDTSLNKKVLSERTSLNKKVLSEEHVTQQKSIEWQGTKKAISGSKTYKLRKTKKTPIDNYKNIDNYFIYSEKEKEENQPKESFKEGTMHGTTVLDEIKPKGDKAFIGKRRKTKLKGGPREARFWYKESQRGILTETGFIGYYRKQLFERFFKKNGLRFDDFKLSERYESTKASEILDILYENKCRNEITAKAWVDWYVGQLAFGKLGRKFNETDITIHGLAKSWKKFSPNRPKEYSMTTKGVVRSKSVSTNDIFSDLDSIFKTQSETQSQKMSVALSQYGVLLVAAFLSTIHSKADTEMVISTFLHNQANSLSALAKIYTTTNQFMCDYVSTHDVILKDWATRFSELWGPSKDLFADSEISKYSGFSNDFFNFIEQRRRELL